MYIYKILFQIMFSFSVISLYLSFKRYSLKPIAFLSAFYFMSFPTFLNDMPMQNRQEMALFFFALVLLVLFNKTVRPRLKEILFLVFGFSMIVSHYSTSYIAVALFILTYLISFVLKRNFIKEKIHIGNKNYYLTGVMVLGIVVFTFLWNTQITRTSGGLTYLVTQDLKSGETLYSIFSWKKLDKNKLFDEYVLASTKEVELSGDKDLYYEKDTYEKYKLSLLDDDILPLTSLGRKLKDISLDVFSLNYFLRQGIAKIIQLFIILGFIVLILNMNQYIKNVDSEYNVLAFVSILLTGLLILLPMFSIEYGTLRFFQQTLIVLALPTVIGSLIIFHFLSKDSRLYVSVAIFVILFLSLSGFVPQILGGYYPQLHLNNQGIPYDCFYIHKTEVLSTNWLKGRFSNTYNIQSNQCMYFKMLVVDGLVSSGNLLPATIKKNDYVYLDYSNVNNEKNMLYFNGDWFIHNYPVEFLDENKNLIYNNSGSKIYK